jgi:uncharacterized integral membrane protein (TIGR00698 family)
VATQDRKPSIARRAVAIAPGLLLCLALAAAAVGVEAIEARLLSERFIEALVLAILVGAVTRSLWEPGARFAPGVAFCARTVLEIAIVMLGASISASALAKSGPTLLAAIVATVAITLAFSYAVARALGLRRKTATLIACGNAICGNSAIAAVAPVIGADGDDVASSISFTALLGVLVVLGLPLLGAALSLTPNQYGVVAGLSVYAVPQVLAAAAPAGPVAVQIGTLVKLVRVLTLGPVVLILSLLVARRGGAVRGRPGLSRLAPWFILGFLALATLRSVGLVPDVAVAPLARVSGALTIVSMAALGLGVDVRALARTGPRATLAVTLSLLGLIALSLALARLLPLA